MGCSIFLCYVILSLLIVFLSLMVESSINSASPSNGPLSVTPKNIFILAGQSNMAGRGGDVKNSMWDKVVPSQCKSNPRILRLNLDRKWEEASEPLHRDIDTTKKWGVGPGMPFANSILARDLNIGMIGLVPCAVGGTNIRQWGRDSFYYKRLVERAHHAINGTGGRIRAMLWYQGESESYSTTKDVASYKRELDEFFTNVRSDLHLPMLPVIQVALASGGKYIESIREAQLNNDLPNVVTIDAKGLALERDNLHLTTASQVQLGQKLADAFLTNFKNT